MNALLNPYVHFEYAGLFRSEKKWIHPERMGSNYEIVHMTQGEMDLREGERDYHLVRGQTLILSPGKWHKGLTYSEKVSFYWVHFSLTEGELPFSQRFFDCFDHVALFKELLHDNNLPHVEPSAVQAVLVHILAELYRLSDEHLPHYDRMAEQICEWIRVNVDAKLTVRALAEHFGYSPDHLSRICRKNYAVGARELIDRFLLVKIKERLVDTDLYIKEIAAELEFSDDKALIGFFKYHEDCSPGEFRNRFSRLHMNRK